MIKNHPNSSRIMNQCLMSLPRFHLNRKHAREISKNRNKEISFYLHETPYQTIDIPLKYYVKKFNRESFYIIYDKSFNSQRMFNISSEILKTLNINIYSLFVQFESSEPQYNDEIGLFPGSLPKIKGEFVTLSLLENSNSLYSLMDEFLWKFFENEISCVEKKLHYPLIDVSNDFYFDDHSRCGIYTIRTISIDEINFKNNLAIKKIYNFLEPNFRFNVITQGILIYSAIIADTPLTYLTVGQSSVALRSLLLSKTYKTDVGDFKFQRDHHTELGLYSTYINDNYKLVIERFLSSKSHSFPTHSNYIYDLTTDCNLESGSGKLVYEYNKRIYFSMDGLYFSREETLNLLLVFESLVENLNNKNDLSSTYYTIHFLQFLSALETREFLLRELSENAIIYVFSIRNNKLLSLIENDPELSNVLAFSPFFSYGNDCNENVIKTGMLFPSLFLYIKTFIQSYYFSFSVVIFETMGVDSTSTTHKLVEFLRLSKVDVKDHIVLPKDIEITSDIVISNIKNLPKSCVIINLLFREQAIGLAKELYLLNYRIPSIVFFFFTIFKSDFNEQTSDYLQGHMIFSLNEKVYEIKEISNYLEKRIHWNSFITQEIISLVISFEFFKVIEKSEDPISSIKQGIEIVTDRSTISLSKGLYITQFIEIFYNDITLDSFISVFSNIDGDTPNPVYFFLNEEYRECSFEQEPTPITFLTLLIILQDSYNQNIQNSNIELDYLAAIRIFNELNGGVAIDGVEYILRFETIKNSLGSDDFRSKASSYARRVDIAAAFVSATIEEALIVQEYFFPEDKPIFFTERSQGQECVPGLIFTGLIPFHYYSPLLNFFSDFMLPKEIYLIGSSEKANKDLLDYFEYEAKFLFKIKGRTVIDESTSDFVSIHSSFFEVLPNGGYIICALDISILHEIIGINYSSEKIRKNFKFVSLNLDRSHFYYYPLEIFNGLIFIDTVDINSVHPNYIKFRTQFFQYTASKNFFSSTESIFHAFLIYKESVLEQGSFLYHKLKNSFIESIYEGLFGEIHIHESMVLEKNIFLYEIVDNVYELRRDNILRGPRNFIWINNDYGKMCDHTNNTSIITDANIIRVMIVCALTGFESKLDDKFFEIIKMTLSEIYVVTRQIFDYVIVDTKSDSTVCYYNVQKQLKSKMKFHVIFHSGSKVCRSLLSKELVAYDILIFTFSHIAGDECDQNIFYAGTEPTVIKSVIDRYLMTSIKEFAIVRESTESSKEYSNYISQYLFLKVGITTYEIEIPFNTQYALPYIESLGTHITNGLIILLLHKEMHVLFHNTVVTSGLGLYEDNSVYSVYTYEEVLAEENIQFISYRATIFDKKSQEKLNLMFSLKNYVSKYMIVTESNTIIYSVLFMWAKAMKSVEGEPDRNLKIKNKLYEYHDTMMGRIRFDSSNYLSTLLYLVDSKNGLISSSLKVYQPVPWKLEINGGTNLCNFKNNEIGEKHRLIPNKVLIFVLNEEIVEVLEEISTHLIIQTLFAIDILNEKRSQFNKIIEPVIVTTHFDDYQQNLVRVLQRNNIWVYMGGNSVQEKKLISDQVLLFQKYWIFLGENDGIMCNPYLVSININNIQILEIFKEQFFNSFCFETAFISGQSVYELGLMKELKNSLIIMDHLKSEMFVYNENNHNLILDHLTSNPNSCIVTSYSSFNKKALNLLQLIRQVSEQSPRQVIHTLFANDIINKFDMTLLEGHFYSTTFSQNLGNISDLNYNSLAQEFLDVYSSYFGIYAVPLNTVELVYSFMGILQITSNIIKTDDIEKVINHSKGKTFFSPSGTNILRSYNHVARPLYSLKIVNGKSVSSFKSKSYYDPLLFYKYEQMKSFSCVDTSLEKSRTLLLVLETETNYLRSSFSLELYAIGFVNSINKNNKFYGIFLDLEVYYFESDSVKPRDNKTMELEDIYKRKPITLIIGCETYECRSLINDFSFRRKSLFFIVGKGGENNMCNIYSFEMQPSFYQKFQLLIDFLEFENIQFLYTIRDNCQTNINEMSYLNNMLKNSKFSNFGFESLTESSTDERIAEIINKLIEQSLGKNTAGKIF